MFVVSKIEGLRGNSHIVGVFRMFLDVGFRLLVSILDISSAANYHIIPFLIFNDNKEVMEEVRNIAFQLVNIPTAFFINNLVVLSFLFFRKELDVRITL